MLLFHLYLDLLLLDLLVQPHPFVEILDIAPKKWIVGLIEVPKLIVLIDEG